MSKDDVEIRGALPSDFARVTEIYNHYVATTAITFDVTPFTLETRRPWFTQFTPDGPHRLIVAARRGDVVGYAGSHQFRPKPAYASTIETTIYCAPDAVGPGIGRRLYTALFAALGGLDLHLAVAAITTPNPASIALHERFGFTLTGVTPEVGRKLGRYWDVAWYAKRL